LEQIVSVEEVVEMQEAVKNVYVADPVKRYIVELTRYTRNHGDVYLGASTRGSLALFRAGQSRAALQGRDYVLPDDIKELAIPCLAHRVILGPAARLRDVTADSVMTEILDTVAVPGGDLAPAV